MFGLHWADGVRLDEVKRRFYIFLGRIQPISPYANPKRINVNFKVAHQNEIAGHGAAAGPSSDCHKPMFSMASKTEASITPHPNHAPIMANYPKCRPAASKHAKAMVKA